MVFSGGAVSAAMAARIRQLESDLATAEPEQDPGPAAAAQHDLHVAGQTCAYCGRPIEDGETARLAGAGAGVWVHDDCHKPRP
jgi:hypothetical protein